MAEENKDILEELRETEPAKVEKINTEAKSKMRHDQETVMNALKYLANFNKEEKYQYNMQVTVEYIEDIIAIMGEYKKMAEDTSQLLYDIMLKVEKAAKAAPQDHKKKVIIKNATNKKE